MVIIVEIISKRVNRDSGLIEEGIIYFFSGLPYFSTMIEQGIAEPYVLLGKGTFSFIIVGISFQTWNLRIRMHILDVKSECKACSSFLNHLLVAVV